MNLKNHLKILLIQIRQDPSVKQEELESFSRYSDIPLSNFTTHDVFEDDKLSVNSLQEYDALFVGGASEASVLEPQKYPFVKDIIDVFNHCIKIDFPVFASCFGFQVAILAFGGEISKDVENFEMGTYPLSLTDSAKEDAVFKNISNGFMAVSVHQEKATDLPANCELLAYTDECIHSFKYKGKRFWAFQFHPELDKTCLTQRLDAYKEKYTEDKEHFQSVIDTLVETPESNKLVSNFTDILIR